MIVSDYIASELVRRGVTRVFEVTGGMITYLLDAFHRNGNLQIISVRHEQTAAMAADVYGRLKGIPGVALATSGPGATNLLTGIAGAYFDSSPSIYITGQVNRDEQRGKKNIRQQGFQETDIVLIAQSITKGAWRVNHPDEIPVLLNMAFSLAMEGRPGPVLIDIPMDVQRSEIVLKGEPLSPKSTETVDSLPFFEDLRQSLMTSKRPLILAGGGIRSAQATDLFRKWARQVKIPVVYSLMGLDSLPSSDETRIGLIGTNGNRWANKALMEADLLIVLGSRLDIRQTGSVLNPFLKQKIFHVDCARDQINNRIKGCISLLSDIKDFLMSANIIFQEWDSPSHFNLWRDRIIQWRSFYDDCSELALLDGINPNQLIREITKGCDLARVITTDVGQNQMWVAQSAYLREDVRFLTHGGLGAMGFALPAAIGASLERGLTLLFAGDGGFQMNIQELETVAYHNLPIKMIILNNQSLGMVRQFQDAYFDGRHQSTILGYSAPNFEKIALAYGIPARSIHNSTEIVEAIEWIKKNPGPCLLQVYISTSLDLCPKVMFGRSLAEMEPPVALA